MTKMKRVLSLLLAVLMVAGLILVPVSADGESVSGAETTAKGMEVVSRGGPTTGTDKMDGLEMSKFLSYDDSGNLRITLEVYATGEKVTQTVQVDAPTDIILVLDQSGSMSDSFTKTIHAYNKYTDTTNSNLYSNKDNLWVKVGDQYVQVTVTENKEVESTTSKVSYTKLEGTMTDWFGNSNSRAYNNRDKLYTLVGDVYVPVTVTRSGGWQGLLATYTYSYTNPDTGEVVTKLSDYATGTPPWDLYVRNEETTTTYKYTYTYTYTDPNTGALITATSEGQSTNFKEWELYAKGNDGTETTTRLAALKDAVTAFVNEVSAKAKGPDGVYGTADDVNHRIAVVGFASDNTTGNYKNTELFIGATQYNYNTNASQYYNQAFQDMNTEDGYKNVMASKDALAAEGGTAIDLGTQMANSIFDAYKADYEKETGRAKIVVVFTDGVPGIYENDSNDTRKTYAETAINNTYKSQDTYGAKVYTIGVFDNASNTNPGPSNLTSKTSWNDADVANKFMHLLSSDYPQAKGMDSGEYGTMNSTTGYYMAANDTETLNNIFGKISQDVDSSTTSVTLGTETVVKDVISDSFQLPEGTTTEDIVIRTYNCTGKSNGEFTWGEANTDKDDELDTMGATANIDDGNVSVSGFDFSGNYVYADSNGKNARGSKLEISFRIEDKGTAMGQVSTNDASSGVYENSSATEYVAPFKQPIVNFPYFQVGHIESKVDTTGEKTGTAGKNYGEQNGELVKYRVYENTPFNLVSKVTDGYLYGGAFSTKDCDAENVQKFADGENALSYTPEAGAVYYIWEVPDKYLPANVYNVWKTNGDGLTRLYMLTAADRELYQKVGFDVTGYEGAYISGQDDSQIKSTDGGTLYGVIEVEKMGSGYQTVYLVNGKMTETTQGTTLAEDAYHDEGFIGGYRMTNGMFNTVRNNGGSVIFQSYWVTLDGIKVYGLKQATLTYTEGNTKATVTRTPKAIDPAYVGIETDGGQGIMLMSFAEVYAIGDSAEPTVTITVHDNGSVYTQSADEELNCAGAEGQVFAGWFLDEDYTTPVDFDSITESTDVYAKYVSDAYLQVKYNKLGLFRVSGVSLVSAVDDVDGYAETGILVNGEKVSVSYSKRYMLLFTASSLFDGASRDAQLMTAQLSLSGSGSLEVTPYWVTLDGTTVYGQSRTISYTARSIQG